jgi:hypothetical protein
MNAERRNQIVLAALIVVLGAALYQAFSASGSVAETDVAAVGQSPNASRRPAGPGPVTAPDVRLESLEADRTRPGGAERNLFRFGARPSAERRPREDRLPPPAPMPVQTGPTTPSVAPITLRFIGVVQATAQAQTYAVLRDDRGVYHGREGDVIEGRYRILRIGTESIDLAYVNGSGRQTIRLGS